MKIGIMLKKLLVYDQKPAATSLRHHSFNLISTYLISRLANFPFGFEVLGKRFDARKELFHCNQNKKIYTCSCGSIILSNQNCCFYLHVHVGSLLMLFRIRFTASD